MGEGKTAFLPYFGGSGSEAASRLAADLPCDVSSSTSLLHCPTALGERVMLRVVKQYTDMGKHILASGALKP